MILILKIVLFFILYRNDVIDGGSHPFSVLFISTSFRFCLFFLDIQRKSESFNRFATQF